jgi:hypothetical protein
MGATWDHPVLGRFNYDDIWWTRIVDVPAFAAFAYDTGLGSAGRSKGKHESCSDPVTAARTICSSRNGDVDRLARPVSKGCRRHRGR